MTERTVKTSVKEQNLKSWKKGESGNPAGRPKGQRDYATIYREAMIKIGQATDMTPEQVEEEMIKAGLDKAMQGDYKFYQDALDRLHGKPKQSLEHTGEDGKPIEQSITVRFE